MKVFKFGGASVSTAEAIRNVADIIKKHSENEPMLVALSAIGKTTDTLEHLWNAYLQQNQDDIKQCLSLLTVNHLSIAEQLFETTDNCYYKEVAMLLNALRKETEAEQPTDNHNYEYDRLVCFGELISTRIVSGYLNSIGMSNVWLDARSLVKTDNHHRKADIDWMATKVRIREKMASASPLSRLFITQGFIGSAPDGTTTTLGREGSDFSAAVFAHCLDAKQMVIWKDVPGFFNADPKHFPHAQKLDKISYREAIELAYCGANVIHPKTIKPLENKQIPLFIKSFLQPEEAGTLVCRDASKAPSTPAYVLKSNQALLSISAKDFSFITDHKLVSILKLFNGLKLDINLMQNTSLNFWACVDSDKQRLMEIRSKLESDFHVQCATEVELITIKHYNDEIIRKTLFSYKPLIEQRSRHTVQFVVEKT